MRTIHWRATAAALACLIASPAGAATTIGFEDLAGTGTALPASYAGLEWTNFFAVDAADGDLSPSGYLNAAVSGSKSIYNGFEAAATIAGMTGLRLESAFFTAAFNDGLEITAQAFDGSVLLYSTTFTVDTNGPTRRDFGWSGMTSVTFSATGGTDRFFDQSGTNFAIDDISVVPEPATWLTMTLGLGAVALALRRRNARRFRAVAG
jgi:hypothetical protein